MHVQNRNDYSFAGREPLASRRNRPVREQSRLSGLAAIALLVGLVMLSGCSSTNGTAPEDVMPSEFAGAPNWVLGSCAAYWEDEDGARLCGVGQAKIGQSLSIARQKADARARAEISRTLETKVKDMVKDYQEQITDGEAEMTAEQFSTTTISLSKATLNGTSLQQFWVSPSGQLYHLMALDIESFENSLREMDDMSDRMRQFIEARARKSFAELDDQVEDY